MELVYLKMALSRSAPTFFSPLSIGIHSHDRRDVFVYPFLLISSKLLMHLLQAKQSYGIYHFWTSASKSCLLSGTQCPRKLVYQVISETI